MAIDAAKVAPEPEPEPSQAEASERLRVVIGRLSRRLRPTVAGSGLTPSQISVLFTVVRLGPVGLSELAQVESLNATMLSRITAQLCDAGLIVRSADPGDRRSANVAATAAGRRIRERIHRERTRALSAHVQELDEQQRKALWNALPVLEELAQRLPSGRTVSGERR
ncbi:MAG: MarR family winged helix-turn-helix transcriptional regulator [Solirubrobacteraceae bacterium]|jgi:DNA-binding MarR family transcriptional regulator